MTTHTPTPDTDLWALAGRLHEAYEAGQPGYKLFAAAKEAATWAQEQYSDRLDRRLAQLVMERNAAQRRAANLANRLLVVEAEEDKLSSRVDELERERDKLRKRVEELEAGSSEPSEIEVYIYLGSDRAAIHNSTDDETLATFFADNSAAARTAAYKYVKSQGWRVVAFL